MSQSTDKRIYHFLFYLVALGFLVLAAAIAYEWYFDRWIDNGAEYYDDIADVNKKNHFRSRGRKDPSTGKQGYWVYWRPGPPHKTEVIEWFGKLKSRRIVSYPGQGKKLKEGIYQNDQMNGFWVFWTITMQVDRKLTGLYKNNKLIRNARNEFFPMPSAGHPYDQTHATIRLIIWISLISIILLFIILWIYSSMQQHKRQTTKLPG